MIPIQIIAPHPPRACRPAVLLKALMVTGRAARFVAAASAPELDGQGNCHEIALSLMLDLRAAGCGSGWCWATGRTRPFGSGGEGDHSWIEVGGWSLDTIGNSALFADRREYYRLQEARNVTLRDVEETAAWLLQLSRHYIKAVSGTGRCWKHRPRP